MYILTVDSKICQVSQAHTKLFHIGIQKRRPYFSSFHSCRYINHVEIMFFNIVLFLPILKQSFGKSVPILETKNLILNNGHKMPLLGFSTFNWKASPSRMKDAVYEAIKIGYRYKLFSHTVRELFANTAKLSSLDILQ